MNDMNDGGESVTFGTVPPPKVIAACAAAARWRNSLALIASGSDVPVDIVGLTAALSACGGARMILHVILFQLMISRVSPDV